MPANAFQALIQRPTGLLAVDGRAFPLKRAAIRARAAGGLARTTFCQSYDNPYGEPLEVLYTLALPADGSMFGYTIRMGETVITGQIESRMEARKAYRKALEEGRTAGLLEQDRADTFTQSLGCLPPATPVEVEIDVLHPLAFHPRASADGVPSGEQAKRGTCIERGTGALAGRWEYRFPTVVGVRFEGAPGRVQDAQRLDADRADANGTPVRLTLDLLLADGTPQWIAPRSPSHDLHVEAGPDGGCRLALAEPARLDRDLVVTWQTAEASVGVRLVEGGGLPGDNGRYALLTLTPPAQPQPVMARDLTLLLDCSGSMDGHQLELAKQLAEQLLRSLTPRDRFELIAFATERKPLVKGPCESSPPNLNKASEALRKLHAGGGTEMAHAIRDALCPLRPGSQRQVVLITDGYIGFEDEVIAHVLRDLPAGARLHTVGIGAAPNRTLTQGASRAGRGVEVLLGSEMELAAGGQRLLGATVAPLLTDLHIGGTAVLAQAPARPRDVLAGQPLLALLELAPAGGTVELGGELGSGDSWTTTVQIAPADGPSPWPHTDLPLGAAFGREAVADEEMHLTAAATPWMLDEEPRASGDFVGIPQRIEQLGLRHRIVTRETSLVAIAETPTVDPLEPRRRQRLAVELPAGVSAEGVGLAGVGLPALRKLEVDCATSVGIVESGRMLESVLGHISAPPPPTRMSARAIPGLAGVLGKLAGARRTGPAPPGAVIVAARCLRVDGDLLVLEFESPWDGFELATTGTIAAEAFRADTAARVELQATVDPLSTRPGPYAAGLTLRLVLRTADGSPWRVVKVLVWVRSADRSAVIMVEIPLHPETVD